LNAALGGLRLAPGRRVFLLEDGRAAVLEGGPWEGRILSASGLAEVLEAAAGGLDAKAMARLALRGHIGVLQRLRAGGFLVPLTVDTPIARDSEAEARFSGVLDLRHEPCASLPHADERPLLLLVADHLDPVLEPVVREAWCRGITVLPVACRPGRMLAGPIAAPGLACMGCLLRRQAGLRPLAAALWSGLGGARALPPAAEDLAEAPASAARLAAALLDRAAPGLLSLTPGQASCIHTLHAGPGCRDCPAIVAPPPCVDGPAGLLAALAPWIDPESGLATPPKPATPPGAPIAIQLSRPAIVQESGAFDTALAHGLALCVGKALRQEEAALGAVAEAIERGALLHGPDPCVAQALRGGNPYPLPRAVAVLAPVAGTPHDLDFEPSGTAFGRDAADATLRALLERIERDAALVWWRRAARLPPLALPSETQALHDAVARQLGPERAPPWLLDATTELGAHVAVAVSVRQDGTLPVVGFGAGLDVEAAAAAALRELVAQAERLAGALRVAEAADAAAPLTGWSQAGSAAHALLRPKGAPRPPPRRAARSLAELVETLATAGFEPFAIRHAELWPGGPCVMRVVVPGLQGAALSEGDMPRLCSLPERLGWDCVPYGPQSLNPWPFPG
jgi:ribosomal protein S12 methylthiotransferase accessory factor YcaO